MQNTTFLGQGGAAALWLVLGACSSTGAASAPGASSYLSPEAVVLAAPVERQDELYECGLDSISALCGYYSVEIPAERRTELARRAREEQGLSGGELREALQSLGFEVFVFSGALDDSPTGLRRHIDARRPLLVMTAMGGENHYSLLIGYDPEHESVVLLDPLRGRVVLPSTSFDRLWETTRRFTLLALPAGTARTPTSPASTSEESTR